MGQNNEANQKATSFQFLYFNIFPNIKAGMGVLSVSRFLVGLWGWYLNQQSPRVVKTYFSSPTHQTSPRQLWQIQSV